MSHKISLLLLRRNPGFISQGIKIKHFGSVSNFFITYSLVEIYYVLSLIGIVILGYPQALGPFQVELNVVLDLDLLFSVGYRLVTVEALHGLAALQFRRVKGAPFVGER